MAKGKLDAANFKPGPQKPQKYAQTGANYAQWGEQPLMVYDPFTDSYYRDKKAYSEYLYTSGQEERPKGPPSLLDTVLPIAATAGTAALAQEVGKGLASGKGIGGLLDFGGSAAAGEVAKTTAPQVLQGLQGLGAAESAGAASQAAIEAGVGSLQGGAPAAPGLFSGIGSMGSTLGGAGALGGIAAGTYLGGEAALDMIQGKKAKLPGRVILGMATGGLSEIGNALFNRKTTRDLAKENTASLLEQGKDNAPWQNYVGGMREQYNSAPTDPSKPFAGMFGTFDEYKAAGLRADDLTGVLGNLKTYGPEWAGLSFDQQKAVTQLNINDGLYDSSKGEVTLSNEQKAKENLAKVLQPQASQPAPAQAMGGLMGIANQPTAKKESWMR